MTSLFCQASLKGIGGQAIESMDRNLSQQLSLMLKPLSAQASQSTSTGGALGKLAPRHVITFLTKVRAPWTALFLHKLPRDIFT
jgi:hypothetical protein